MGIRREGFGEGYDGGEFIHLPYLLSIEQPGTWTSLGYTENDLHPDPIDSRYLQAAILREHFVVAC